MAMFLTDRALKYLFANRVWTGGIMKVPPAHGRSFEVKLLGNGSPDNDLAYSLTWP